MLQPVKQPRATQEATVADTSSDPVAALVRSADFDRYAATLFAPAEARPHLLALYAFDIELARVPDLVSEPMPGELRLQWWRDALEEPERADAVAHPVMRALETAIVHGKLPRQALADLIDARTDDLYDDPVASVEQLEARLGATASVVLRLASLVLANGREPRGADVAGHGGVARGLVGMLRTLPLKPHRVQPLLPADRMAAHGVTREQVLQRRTTPGVIALAAELRALAKSHLEKARAAYGPLDPVAAPAFLPLAETAADLNRLGASPNAPFVPKGEAARWARLVRLWRASRRAPPF